jgi:hypothetical protein
MLLCLASALRRPAPLGLVALSLLLAGLGALPFQAAQAQTRGSRIERGLPAEDGARAGLAATYARSNTEARVLRVVERMFDGMRRGDAATLRAVFDPSATLLTARPGVRAAEAKPTPVERFIAAAGEPHNPPWIERAWDPQVRIDGPLATVWTPYAFFLGNKLSHCGTNAFQLVRRAGGWRIVHVVDTRRTNGCQVPDSVRP